MSLALQSAFSKMCRISARFMATPSLTSSFAAQADAGAPKGVPPKHVAEIPKIRRPLSPFAVFMKSQYSKLKSEHPSSKATDVMKLASGLYAKLPQDEKKRLVDAAASDRQRYETDMKHLTQEQRSELTALSQKKRHSRAIKERRRLWRATGRPIRPMNAPLLFMKERWGNRGARKVTDYVKDLMTEWRALPEEQKQKYRQIEADAKKKFEAECAAWQAKQPHDTKQEDKPTKKKAKTASSRTSKRKAPRRLAAKAPKAAKTRASKPQAKSETAKSQA